MDKQTELPEGDFFFLYSFDEEVYPRGQYDLDPEETRSIRARREASCREWGLEWPDYHGDDIFTGCKRVIPPLRREFVHRRIGYKRTVPKNYLHHYIRSGSMDYATGQRGYHLSYRVVSGAWKAVVEEVEPDTHQFFNCDLCFTDKIVPYFIFNPRVVVEMRANKDQRIADARVPYKLPLRRSSITGRHWTSQLHFGWQFASRQLAERLLSLLPPETSFVPQWAVD